MTLLDANVLEADYSASPAPVRVTEGQNVAKATGLAENENEAPKPFILPKGIWFDWAWNFHGPDGDALTNTVLELIAPYEGLSRKRSARKFANHEARVRSILANGYRASCFFQPAWVAYFIKPDSKPYLTKSKPDWFYGRAMRDTIDAMSKAGLLTQSIGENNEASSVYRMTQTLFLCARDAGITEQSLTHRLSPEELIRLCKTNGNDELLDFEWSDENKQWTSDLLSYNAFIAQQDIRLNLTAQEEAKQVANLNHGRGLGNDEFDTTPVYYRLELMRTELYRKFNNGSFEQGGRLYGGWWQNILSGYREKITINDKPTVELDYSGCAIHMLYHQRNKQCAGYPYTLNSISADETGRIKDLTQILINGTRKDRKRRADHPFSGELTVGRVLQLLEERHAPIADAFYSGAGIFLQRKDADIALSIITSLKNKGIVALPIHDSFIVTAEYEEELRKEMIFWYRNEFGYDPFIK